MTPFVVGREYRLHLTCRPPKKKGLLPWIGVQMSRTGGEYRQVSGKVDTGSPCTILNYDAARDLGIAHPGDSPGRTGLGRTATGDAFEYHIHDVWVRIEDQAGARIEFPLEAGFSPDVRNNLFGLDWLQHLCLAVDGEAVHLLQD